MAENNNSNNSPNKGGTNWMLIAGFLVALYLLVNNTAQGTALGGILYQQNAMGQSVAEVSGQTEAVLAGLSGVMKVTSVIQGDVSSLAGIVGDLGSAVSGLSAEVGNLTWAVSGIEQTMNNRFAQVDAEMAGLRSGLEALSGGMVSAPVQPQPGISTPPTPTPNLGIEPQYVESNGGRTGGFLGSIANFISGN